MERKRETERDGNRWGDTSVPVNNPIGASLLLKKYMVITGNEY